MIVRRSSSAARSPWTTGLRATGAVLASGALAAGCGVIPGTGGDSKAPITVMTWAPENTSATNMPGMPGMAQAYARYVNASGGLAGHELKVLVCNEHNTPEGAAACAREAVDAKAVAVVGSYSQWGEQFMAPLEAASIPYLGGYGLSEEEFSSYLSYPVNGGQAALLAGSGIQLAGECEHTALVRPDTIVGDDLPLLMDAGLAEKHRPKAGDFRAPEDATGFTKEATQALDDAGDGGCVSAVLGDKSGLFFDAYRRIPKHGDSVRVSSVVGGIDQPLVDSTGGKNGPFEDALVTGWYPEASDPAWKPMDRMIMKYAFGDNNVDPSNPGVQTTWIAYTALRQVVEAMDQNVITPGKLSYALDRGATVHTGGLTPTLRWKYEDMLGAPGFPRVVNRDVTFQVVHNGILVAQRKGFVNVGSALENSDVTS